MALVLITKWTIHVCFYYNDTVLSLFLPLLTGISIYFSDILYIVFTF
jgi:hypothetical protein